jgi:hypothetical protein
VQNPHQAPWGFLSVLLPKRLSYPELPSWMARKLRLTAAQRTWRRQPQPRPPPNQEAVLVAGLPGILGEVRSRLFLGLVDPSKATRK